MTPTYDAWLAQVREALASINMPLDQWQARWRFDFEREFGVGTSAGVAAEKANRFWWFNQNKELGEDCLTMPNCWLPRKHQGRCEPVN